MAEFEKTAGVSDRRNRRQQTNQNGQCQEATQENRHLVHLALLNAGLAVHWTLRDEGKSQVPALPGHCERLAEPVTASDKAKKYGSDGHLIRMGDGLAFSSAQRDVLSTRLVYSQRDRQNNNKKRSPHD
ncbi:hypothetical protein JRG42_18900 [Pseudomonas granadensis]|uniref:Uncharacterized protein n=1 Tax=Pseudomonas granadensis TaxID=1421430 RepID=A0ABX7GLJ3_9PSED|nr:hypothetical protein [Pseudomonas granadensis]MBN6772669.1 hypothetical protein [Pseudomonas granadensis]MBN6806391.1 hypothetical protein [Pseudomonas granadensis]MBN6830970.1 hypothetical protein [Pseudomonas granadensis]MBN6840748.1 hypothetical protein [Pseudomonas granadensis]MBN6867874.1 hypothetical protein [Pseudomonas granadensis]